MKKGLSELIVFVALSLLEKVLVSGFVAVKHSKFSHLLRVTKDEEANFPVLSKIQGIRWEGKCRYVNGSLKPVDIALTGGVSYAIEGDECKLISFLSFPDGRTRTVEMTGKRGSRERPSFRLDPTFEGGPMYMVLTELAPDTVLLNEVDKASGKIVMTSSLSITDNQDEIVQVSHEIGDGDLLLEGHQVWRLGKAGVQAKSDDFSGGDGYRGKTGR